MVFTNPHQPCYIQFFVNGNPPVGLRTGINLGNIKYICQQVNGLVYYSTMFDERQGISVFSAYVLTPTMHGQWQTFVPVDRYLVPSKHHSRSEHTSCGPVGSSREAQRLSSDIYSKFDVDRWLLFASKWGAKLCSVWEQRTKRSAELDSANVRCITRNHFIARCSASRHGETTAQPLSRMEWSLLIVPE